MIENEVQYHQTLRQLALMDTSLGELRANVLPKNAQMFAVMAEGPSDYIRQFEQELAEYAATHPGITRSGTDGALR